MPGMFGKTTKEDLIALGLDPDKTVKKEDLDTFKAGITTDVTTSIQNSIAALEAKLTDALATRQAPPPENKPESKPNEPQQVDSMMFLEDPMKHVNDAVNKTAAQLLAVNMRQAAEMAYETLSSQLPGFKNDVLKAEIDKEWAAYANGPIAKPKELLRNLHDMVIGRHTEEIQRDSAKREGKFNMVHSGGSRTMNQAEPPQAKPEDSLTDAELAAAKNFGMTPEEYAKQKGGLSYA